MLLESVLTQFFYFANFRVKMPSDWKKEGIDKAERGKKRKSASADFKKLPADLFLLPAHKKKLEVERKSAGNYFGTMLADFQMLGAQLFLLSAHFNSAPANVSKVEERIENTEYKFYRMGNFFGTMPVDF